MESSLGAKRKVLFLHVHIKADFVVKASICTTINGYQALHHDFNKFVKFYIKKEESKCKKYLKVNLNAIYFFPITQVNFKLL